MSLWGMDDHGEPVNPEAAAIAIVEHYIAAYIDGATKTALAGLGNLSEEVHKAEAIKQMRWLHLAEPHLPAIRAVQGLRESGLLTP